MFSLKNQFSLWSVFIEQSNFESVVGLECKTPITDAQAKQLVRNLRVDPSDIPSDDKTVAFVRGRTVLRLHSALQMPTAELPKELLYLNQSISQFLDLQHTQPSSSINLSSVASSAHSDTNSSKRNSHTIPPKPKLALLKETVAMEATFDGSTPTLSQSDSYQAAALQLRAKLDRLAYQMDSRGLSLLDYDSKTPPFLPNLSPLATPGGVKTPDCITPLHITPNNSNTPAAVSTNPNQLSLSNFPSTGKRPPSHPHPHPHPHLTQNRVSSGKYQTYTQSNSFSLAPALPLTLPTAQKISLHTVTTHNNTE